MWASVHFTGLGAHVCMGLAAALCSGVSVVAAPLGEKWRECWFWSLLKGCVTLVRCSEALTSGAVSGSPAEDAAFPIKPPFPLLSWLFVNTGLSLLLPKIVKILLNYLCLAF